MSGSPKAKGKQCCFIAGHCQICRTKSLCNVCGGLNSKFTDINGGSKLVFVCVSYHSQAGYVEASWRLLLRRKCKLDSTLSVVVCTYVQTISHVILKFGSLSQTNQSFGHLWHFQVAPREREKSQPDQVISSHECTYYIALESLA